MSIDLRRRGARTVRAIALDGSQILRIVVGLTLLWLAITGFSSGFADTSTAFGSATAVLGILSVGHLTQNSVRPLLAIWEIAIGLGIIVPSLSRLALWMAPLRFLLALLPLVMLRDDLFSRFPIQLSPAGQNDVLYILILGTTLHLAARVRLGQLRRDPHTAEMVGEEPLSPEGRAARKRLLVRIASFGVTVALLFAVAWVTLWPRYLRWFHTRQETAVLTEKLSGQLIKRSMPLSPLLGRKITTWVYLPPGYNRSKQRYPVAYVMHGMPGEVRDCFVKGQIHNTVESLILGHKIRPMILVGWDGEGPTGPADVTNFLDRADGSWSMESFIVNELVPYIDRTYRTIPKAPERALVGVSAGGYGAINLMFKHPDIWKIGAAHNGFFDPSDDVDNMTGILGPKGPLWAANDPMETVKGFGLLDGLHVYVDIGQGDELMNEFYSFKKRVAAQKIDHVFNAFPGRHTWTYWSQHFNDSLLFIDSRFNQPTRLAQRPLGTLRGNVGAKTTTGEKQGIAAVDGNDAPGVRLLPADRQNVGTARF